MAGFKTPKQRKTHMGLSKLVARVCPFRAGGNRRHRNGFLTKQPPLPTHPPTPTHTHPHPPTPTHTHPHPPTPTHTHPHPLTPTHTHPHPPTWPPPQLPQLPALSAQGPRCVCLFVLQTCVKDARKQKVSAFLHWESNSSSLRMTFVTYLCPLGESQKSGP